MENLEGQNMERDSYKTGSTNPPKKHSGLVAGLLVAVILLGGVSSVSGVMNIQLFRMLEAEKNSSVAFLPTQSSDLGSGGVQITTGTPKLGITVGSVSKLDQQYLRLPAGALVSMIDPRGCAAKAGITTGDIITAFQGVKILSAQELEDALLSCQAGDSVEIEIYRHRAKKNYRIAVVLDAAEE